MTKPPSRRRKRASLALVLLCALPASGAAQIPTLTPGPEPNVRAAPPLRGPFAVLVPDTLARSLRCVAARPEDSLPAEHTPQMKCRGSTWPSRPADEPRTADAVLKADGEVIWLALQWHVSPAAGEDSVRIFALDSAHKATRTALAQRLGPGTWCNDLFVWRTSNSLIALLPHRRTAPRQVEGLRANSTKPGFGVLLLVAHRRAFPDCTRR